MYKISLVFFIMFLHLTYGAHALKCKKPILEDDFFSSSIVARVKILTENSFEILETYKGKPPKVYKWSKTDSDNPKNRPPNFKKGEEWLVFGQKSKGKVEFYFGPCSGYRRFSPELHGRLNEFKKGDFGCKEYTYVIKNEGFDFQVKAQKFPFKACSKNSVTILNSKKKAIAEINNISFFGEYNWKTGRTDYKPDLKISGVSLAFTVEKGGEKLFRSYHAKKKKLRTIVDKDIGRSAWVLSKAGDFLVYMYSYEIYKVPLTKSKGKELLQEDISFTANRIIGLSQNEKEIFYPIEEYGKDYKSTYKIIILNAENKKTRSITLPSNTTIAEEQLLHPTLDKIAFHTREFDKKEYYKVHVLDIPSSKISLEVDRFSMEKEVLEWRKDGRVFKKPR